MPDSNESPQQTLSEKDSGDAWESFEREFRNFPKRGDDEKFSEALKRFKRRLKAEVKKGAKNPHEKKAKDLLINIMIDEVKERAERKRKKSKENGVKQKKLERSVVSLDFPIKKSEDR